MVVRLDVKITKDTVSQVMAALRELSEQRLMVGVPAENAFRSPDPNEPNVTPPNNAEIAYINEFGEPALRIPARPFLVPTMDGLEQENITQLKKIAQVAITGRPEVVEIGLMRLGIKSVVAIKNVINAGNFEPLSEYTKWRRRTRHQSPHQSTKPLVDFGKMRDSMNYVIRRVRTWYS